MKINLYWDASAGNPDGSGAAAFSVSKSGIDNVCKYILNQPEHHKRVSFAQEYDQFLKFYQANYKVDKVGLLGDIAGY